MYVFDSRLKKYFELSSEVPLLLSASDVNSYYFTGQWFSEDCWILLEHECTTVFSSVLDGFTSTNEYTVLTTGFSGLLEGLSNIKKLNLTFDSVNAIQFNKIVERIGAFDRVKDVSLELKKIRSVKDASEIEKIKKACEETRNIYQFLKELNESESGLEFQFKKLLLDSNMEQSFKPIFAFGRNSAVPHHINSNKIHEEGEVKLFDLGVKYESYCSDLSFTIFPEKPSDRLLKLKTVLENSFSIALKECRAGIKASELFAKVDDYINSTDFKGKFIHSLGHSLGLKVHDGLVISRNSDWILEEGMILTLEPGIYDSMLYGIADASTCGQGGRIEVDVLVRKDDCLAL